jgi:hypothetical protein
MIRNAERNIHFPPTCEAGSEELVERGLQGRCKRHRPLVRDRDSENRRLIRI